MVVQAIEHAPDSSKALERAAAALRSAVAAGKPWIALRGLQPLQEHLDQATWVSLSALLDECPALVGGESAEGTFIATQKQVGAAQAFIAKLGRER